MIPSVMTSSLFLITMFLLLVVGIVRRKETITKNLMHILYAIYTISAFFFVDKFFVEKLNHLTEVASWWNTLFFLTPFHLFWHWPISIDHIPHLLNLANQIQINILIASLCVMVLFAGKVSVRWSPSDWIIFFVITLIPYYYLTLIFFAIALFFPMNEHKFRMLYRIVGILIVIFALFNIGNEIVNQINSYKEETQSLSISSNFDIHQKLDVALKQIPVPRQDLESAIREAEKYVLQADESEFTAEHVIFYFSLIRALIVQGYYEKAIQLIDNIQPDIHHFEVQLGTADMSYRLTQLKLAAYALQGQPKHAIEAITQWIHWCESFNENCYQERHVEALYAMALYGIPWEEQDQYFIDVPETPYLDRVSIELTKRMFESFPRLIPFSIQNN